MIKKVFFTEDTTYIGDELNGSVVTDNLSFTQAFDFAFNVQVPFEYESVFRSSDYIEMSKYLVDFYVNTNRNIYKFFKCCQKLGLHYVVNIESDFPLTLTKHTINNILTDYSCDIESTLYNLEAYGTDTYIANVLYTTLKNRLIVQDDSEIEALLHTIDHDDYCLDSFLFELKKLNKTNVLYKFKKDYESNYKDVPSEAIEKCIPILVNYSGDSIDKIHQAILEVIDDIIYNKPTTAPQEMIKDLIGDDDG